MPPGHAPSAKSRSRHRRPVSLSLRLSRLLQFRQTPLPRRRSRRLSLKPRRHPLPIQPLPRKARLRISHLILPRQPRSRRRQQTLRRTRILTSICMRTRSRSLRRQTPHPPLPRPRHPGLKLHRHGHLPLRHRHPPSNLRIRIRQRIPQAIPATLRRLRSRPRTPISRRWFRHGCHYRILRPPTTPRTNLRQFRLPLQFPSPGPRRHLHQRRRHPPLPDSLMCSRLNLQRRHLKPRTLHRHRRRIRPVKIISVQAAKRPLKFVSTPPAPLRLHPRFRSRP